MSGKSRDSKTKICPLQIACDGNSVQGDFDGCHKCRKKREKRQSAVVKELKGERLLRTCELRDMTRRRSRKKSSSVEAR